MKLRMETNLDEPAIVLVGEQKERETKLDEDSTRGIYPRPEPK